MFSFLGSLLITLSFFLLGAGIAGETKAERAALNALLRVLQTLRDRLLWQREPLDRFFSGCDAPELQKYGFRDRLLSAGTVETGWKNAVLALPLPDEARAELLSLGETLGKTALAPQTERLSLCIATCERVCAELAETEKKQRKSTVAVWTLVGVLLSLLLL